MNIKKIAKNIITASLDLGAIADGAVGLNKELKDIAKQIDDLEVKKQDLMRESDFNKQLEMLGNEIFNIFMVEAKKIVAKYKGLSFGNDTGKNSSINMGTIALVYDKKEYKGMNYAIMSYSILTNKPAREYNGEISDLKITAKYRMWCRGGKEGGWEDKEERIPLNDTINVLKKKIETYIKQGKFKPEN